MIRVNVTKNEFAKIAEDIPRLAHVAVATTALEISAGAKQRSRVKTGTMKRGWYTRYQGQFRAIVGTPVVYAKYNEYGTVHMAAQPMLHPEIEIARSKFAARVRAIFA